jgi:hypothetical protein
MIRFWILDPASGAFFTLDSGSGIENFAPGINVLHPQYWLPDAFFKLCVLCI